MENRFQCSVNGQNCGPYTPLDLQNYLQTGQLPVATLVWNPATNQWEQIQNFLRFNPPTPQPQMNPMALSAPSQNQLASPAQQPAHANPVDHSSHLDYPPQLVGFSDEPEQSEETMYEDSQPDSSGIGALLCVCCYIFAVIDFMGMFFGYDITGVSWSPIAAGFLGTILAGID